MIDRAPGQDRGSGREPIAQDLCGRITKTIGRDLRRLSKVGHIERSQAAGLADRRLDHSGDSATAGWVSRPARLRCIALPLDRGAHLCVNGSPVTLAA